MLVKVQCGCGQKYSFDVEPVGGAMPWTVACPVCGADGTAAANTIIARALGPSAAVAPAQDRTSVAAPVASTAPTRSSIPAPAPLTAPAPAKTSTPAPISLLKPAAGRSPEGEKWKWWYFILFGICYGGYAIWQAYDQHRIKPLGQLFFAVLCIAIGIWDFQHKRKKKRAEQQQPQP